MANTKKKLSFKAGLLIYTAVLLLLIVAGLAFFWIYMDAYESARPQHAIAAYCENEATKDIEQQAMALDASLNSHDDNLAIFQDIVAQSKYLKNVSKSTDDELVYVLKNGSAVYATMKLVPSEESKMGFASWKVTDVQYDFSSLYNYYEISIPAGYKLYCDRNEVGAEYIIDSAAPYEILSDFYDDFDSLPAKNTYKVGPFVGEAEFSVKDIHGASVTPDQLEDAYITDNCTDAEMAEIKTFIDEYIFRYVTFLSGANKLPYANYYNIVPLVVPGSDLQSRLYQALTGGIGFSGSLGDIIQSIEINSAMNVGNDMYCVDATYLVKTYGTDGGTTITTNNTRIMLSRDAFTGSLLGCAQASY